MATKKAQTKTGATEAKQRDTAGASGRNITQQEGALLDAIQTIPSVDRLAVTVTARLMNMATTETPGSVTRELIRKLRDNPELRTDPAHLATILRGMAQAFDGVGQGGK